MKEPIYTQEDMNDFMQAAYDEGFQAGKEAGLAERAAAGVEGQDLGEAIRD